MVTPIAWSQPSGSSFKRAEKSWLIAAILTGQKDKGLEVPGPRCRRSQCSASDPRSRFRNGSPRGLRPPELPAGKRGGWHHDSVYPSFRLTSFAPRAMNFASKCTSQAATLQTTRLFARCPADMSPRAAPPRRLGRSSIFQPVPAPAGFATRANTHFAALRVKSTKKGLVGVSNELLKLKGLAKRVCIKPGRRYLIYYSG